MTRNGCGLDFLAAPRSWYVGSLGHEGMVGFLTFSFECQNQNESIRTGETRQVRKQRYPAIELFVYNGFMQAYNQTNRVCTFTSLSWCISCIGQS
jgi:hypothetical protein